MGCVVPAPRPRRHRVLRRREAIPRLALRMVHLVVVMMVPVGAHAPIRPAAAPSMGRERMGGGHRRGRAHRHAQIPSSAAAMRMRGRGGGRVEGAAGRAGAGGAAVQRRAGVRVDRAVRVMVRCVVLVVRGGAEAADARVAARHGARHTDEVPCRRG